MKLFKKSGNGKSNILDLRGTYKGGGGPDKTILQSAVRHDPDKLNVLVAYLRQPGDNEFQIEEMAKSLGVNYVDFFDGRLLDLLCLWNLQKLIRKEKIRLVHSHDDKTLLYGVLLKCFVPRLQIMYTCHSHSDYRKESFSTFVDFLKYRLRKKIQLGLMGCYAKPILTISENTKKRLVDGGLQPDKVAVLYNGIDVDYWCRSKAQPVLRKELKLADNHFLIGTVARITYDKDFPTFLEVAHRVALKIPNVKFVIVGDGYGDELEKLKKEAEKQGLESVVFFTGHRSDLLNVYASFNLFLLTSLTEGLPNTILEAMAMEVPVVSTNVGGVPELIVPNITGGLCSVGDVQSLTDVVSNLLLQPDERMKMAKSGRKRVEECFNFVERVRILEDYYLSFLGSGELDSVSEGS
ncbi:glycosyltransferase family 4 protein [Desulforhopalus sp. IMCC35007]|nr:glycosyltransferase family 4 protein [Desulforhopalus sp. IMCC35007]